MSKLSPKNGKESKKKNSDTSVISLEKSNLSCSEQKIIPQSICSSNEANINLASNSCSFSENNELFNSLMNSKNNKNKEFSLLYLINTFGKSYSSESKEKNKVVIDLPKISKNLFINSQAKSSSSKNLDNVSFQKNVPIRKSISKGGIMNNFFSSIYEKQMSNSKLMDINVSGQKSSKKKGMFFNSGNKDNKIEVTPFVKGNYKFGNLFNNNKEEDNCETLKGKKINNNKDGENRNRKFNSSLLKIAFGDGNDNNNIEENKKDCD